MQKFGIRIGCSNELNEILVCWLSIVRLSFYSDTVHPPSNINHRFYTSEAKNAIFITPTPLINSLNKLGVWKGFTYPLTVDSKEINGCCGNSDLLDKNKIEGTPILKLAMVKRLLVKISVKNFTIAIHIVLFKKTVTHFLLYTVASV